MQLVQERPKARNHGPCLWCQWHQPSEASARHLDDRSLRDGSANMGRHVFLDQTAQDEAPGRMDLHGILPRLCFAILIAVTPFLSTLATHWFCGGFVSMGPGFISLSLKAAVPTSIFAKFKQNRRQIVDRRLDFNRWLQVSVPISVT